MKRVLLPLVVCLAIVLAAVWWWSRGRGGAPAASAPAGDAGAVTAATPSATKAARTDGPPPGELQVRTEDDPPGELRLEGQVVDGDDRPVGGATVALSSNPPREVLTEADGSFAFEGLLQRAYSVEARKGGDHAGPSTVNVTEKTEPVTLRLAAGHTLEVTVVDASGGKGIAGARVEARGIASQEATTNAQGVAVLTGLGGGYAVVNVQARGYAPVTEMSQLSRQPGSKDKQTVRLHKGVKVAGRVVDDKGQAVAGARVLAEAATGFFSLADPRKDGVDSDKDGRFVIPAVAAGSWRFVATHRRFAPGESETVVIEGSSSPPEVTITMAAAATLAGEVRDGSGKPVPYATVRVAGRDATMFRDAAARQVSCDPEGRFSLEGLPRVPVDVLAAHERGVSDVLPVDLAATPAQTGLVLTIKDGGFIAGTVVNERGEGVAEARVLALPDDFEGDATRWRLLGSISDVADQGGAFRLTGLPEGTYRLYASRSDGSMADASIWLRKPVEARTGATGVKLVLEADAVVKGKVAFADGSSPEVFAVAAASFGQPTTFSSKNGEFRLEGVPPGKRMLTVSGPGFARKTTDELDVKAGEETDVGTITVERGRTIRGRVVDAAGAPVKGAKVIAGSRFFGDGKSVGAGPMGMGSQFGTKDAETDEQGRFEIAGLGVRALVVVADADSGRSPVTPVPPGTADVTLTLVMAVPGQLTGKVLADGKPMASAMVIAQAQAAFRGQLIVTAGNDGIYRFDKLAPDTYLVSALKPRGMGGASMQTEVVKVEPGKVTQKDLSLDASSLTLTVTLKGDGWSFLGGIAWLISGRVVATNPVELEDQLAARGPGYFDQQTARPDAPVRFAGVPPGPYSLCVLAFPGDPSKDPAVLQQLSKDPDSLSIACRAVEVAASPNEQSLSVPVAKPAGLP